MFDETYQYDPRGNQSTLSSSQIPTPSDAIFEYDERNRIKKVAKGRMEVTYR
jgi:uncharacterized protein RhaS with RHS repeats